MTRKNRRSNKLKKNQIIQKNLIRNIAVILVLIVFLFVIYRFNFSSKSELTETVKINFKEFGENISLDDQEMDMEVLTDADGMKYIFLPEKINGYFVQQYHITNLEDSDNTTNNTSIESNSTNTLLENIIPETNTIEEIAGLKKYYLTSQEYEENAIKQSEDNENKLKEENKENKEEDKNEENVVSNTINNSSNTTVQNNVTNETVKPDDKKNNTIKNEVQNNTVDNTIQNITDKDEVINEENDTQENIENVNNNIDESGIKPGTRYNVYETKEKGKYTLGNVFVEVEYQTITNEDIKLYNQELFFKDDSSEITVTGYIPAEYKLNCIKENSTELENQINEYEDLKDYQMLCVYDISLQKDGDIYQPENYDWAPSVSVNIQSTDLNSLPSENDVKLIHFADSIETIEGFETKANSIEFNANGFSKYAVLSKRSITETSVTINTYEEDKNYYLGKNYTDNSLGENSKKYSTDNLADVTINYHSMPENNSRNDGVKEIPYTEVSGTKSSPTGGTMGDITIPYTLTLNGDKEIGDDWKGIIVVSNSRGASFEILDNPSNPYTVNREKNQIEFNLKDYSIVNNSLTINIHIDTKNSSWRYIDFETTLIETTTYYYEYIISNDKTGYISATERQNIVTYHKAVPVNNGQIELELIDNPFMDRPVGTVHEEYSNGSTEDYQTLFGFNGWKNKSDALYIIDTNENTYQQTLKIENVEDKNNVVIDLYVDWVPTNVVFVKSGGTGDGTEIENPAGTWAKAIETLTKNQKGIDKASNREVNIIVVIGQLNADAKTLATDIPYTVTSLYDGIDYRMSPYNATITLNSNITLNNDLQLEYLNVIGSNDYENATSNMLYGKYINGNSYNLRIGRGMKPLKCDDSTSTFGPIQCGGRNNKKFKTVVESGRFSNIYVDRASGNNSNLSMNGTLIVGCDYDRYLEDGNNNLQIFSKVTSRRNSSKNSALDNLPIYDIYIKSGTIGIDSFEKNREPAFSGIYLGGTLESVSDCDVGERKLTIEGGKIANITGGLKANNSDTITRIYVKGKYASIQNIIGGCVQVKTSGDRIIQVTGGTIEYSIFSGSNGRDTTQSDNGSLDGNTLVYVGGSAQIGGTNRLTMNGTDGGNSLYGLQYGCILGAGNGNEKVNTAGVVNSSHIIIDGNAKIENNVYGGGNFAGVSGNTKIDMYGGTIGGNIHGGSNNSGNIMGDASINITGGSINGNVADETSITSEGETKEYEAIFAGGYGVNTGIIGNTNINISNETGIVNINGNIYGGSAMGNVSQKASITVKQINSNNIQIIGNIYGGGKGSDKNSSTNGNDINITIDGGDYSNLSVFGGANKSGYVNGNININIGENNPTKVQSVYGGGNNADLKDVNNNVPAETHEDNIKLGKFATIENVFNGGNNASVNKEFKLKLDVTGSKITNIYGGGNEGNVNGSISITTNEDANITTIHGGGNNGNISGNVELTISKSTVNNVYGGGKNGQVNGLIKVIVNSNSKILEDIYGAGEGAKATVEGNTEVNIDNITVKNVYGGGKLGDVNGQTQVKITSSTIEENAYGAGKGDLGDNDKDNGQFATVKKSKIILEGNSIIKGNVFGGGNASNVGNKGVLESDNTYLSECDAEVYISGAIIGTDEGGGNVYGGSNRSKVWGNTKLYIGKPALDEGYTKGIIDIKGTVFGGGESRTNSTNFDYSFLSVNGDIEINIDADEYDLNIKENIYGSGNASSAKNDGNIYISNFGNETDIKKLKSIQRATNVVINNSELQLLGDTNSTNIHETTLYSLTNIKELSIKNDTTLYLEYGSYSLLGFNSLKYNEETKTDEPAVVTIEDGKPIISGNNRIYMYNGQHLDIINATGDTYGNVNGMTFFGQYKYDNAGEIYKGIYGDGFINHTEPDLEWNHRDFTQSYVLGAHTTDLQKMGFYTVYEDLSAEMNALKERGELNSENYEAEGYHIDYIEPTPNDEKIAYDYWHTGFVTDIINVDLELTASKYSTLGVISKQLTGAEKYPNATLTLDSFSISSGLEEKEIELVEKDTINKIELDDTIANKRFGLLMKTSNNGWINNSSTEFLLNPENYHAQTEDGEDANYKFNINETYKGDNTYLAGSLPNSVAPTLEFYLYNSNTLTLQTGEIGTYKLRMTLTCTANNKYVIVPVIINIKITASDKDETEGYNGVTTPGKKYDIFPQMTTNITDDSSFSTYFELARKDSVSKEEYTNAHRVINTGFALPQNTTITMIDKSETIPKYYYYTVTEPKDEYYLSDFICMGTDDSTKKYKDKAYYINEYKYECFIFIVDFENANFNGMQGQITNSPRMELKLMGESPNPIYRLISSQQQEGRTVYDVFSTTSELRAESKVSNSSIYIGNTSTLTIDSSLVTQATIAGDKPNEERIVNVYNTQYFDKKLGAEIKVLDKNGNQISNLNGTTFQVEEIREVDGIKKKSYNTYTPYNGITRLKLADIFSNTSVPIIINTRNTTNDFADKYTFEIRVFASADGIYNGKEDMSDATREDISFISNEYGLNSSIPENQVIINKLTSTTLDKDGYLSEDLKDLDLHIEYKYSVANPYLTISLARREYPEDNEYSPIYISEGIDLADYLVPKGEKTLKLVSDMNEEKKAIEYEALSTQEMLDASKDQNGKRTVDLNYQIKDDLPLTGTYRITVTLYDVKQDTGETTPGEDDGDISPEESRYQYIGDVYSYIIIK